jgi:hypothetical protein
MAAARIGLIAGPAIGLALLAQQLSVSVEQWCAGAALAVAGLCFAGFVAGCELAADSPSAAAARAGAIAGLLAGLIAALPVTALLLVLSLNGQFALYAEDAFRQLDASGMFDSLRSAGWTSAALARLGVAIQLACYGAGLPVAGLLIGGATARAARRIAR